MLLLLQWQIRLIVMGRGDGRQRWRGWGWSCGGDPMTINIEYQDQFGRWRHYQTQHHQPSAYRTAQSRARTTGKRHRLVDDNGRLLDIVEP